jgi:hypothetical protein
MATAKVNMIYCVSAATGVDGGVNRAIANLAPSLPLATLGIDSQTAIQTAIAEVPGLLQAIDTARQDPDDLYVTTDTTGGVENRVWPREHSTQPTQAGQSQNPDLALPFTGNLNISLWDYDSGSGDDLLGSVTVLESEAGQGEIGKLAASPVESSAYYVVYTVE